MAYQLQPFHMQGSRRTLVLRSPEVFGLTDAASNETGAAGACPTITATRAVRTR
jgi:hypothetical protein